MDQNTDNLWESEERFRKIFECGAIGIVLSTVDHKFKDVNPKFCQMIGYSREELRLMTFLDITHPDDIESSKTLKVKLHTGQIAQYKIDKRYLCKDGSLLWGATTVSMVRSQDGDLLYTIALIEDITKQKQSETEKRELQEKLNRSRKMEALGLLASGIAHDLNNILSVTVAYPDIILLDNTLSEETQHNIEMIRHSGKMASEMVNDLLTIARGVAIKKHCLNLNDTIEEYVTSPDFLKTRELYPSVSINTNLDMELFNVKASHSYIIKILMNLITNAVEAISKENGIVTISTRNQTIEIPVNGYTHIDRGEYAVLSVLDSGDGISQKDLDRIFEPFFTRKVLGRSGSGLGLAVVWNIMRDHGGSIDIKSTERGTVFELYFPKTDEKVVREHLPTSLDEYRGNGQCILIVDREQNQRNILTSILSKLDYKPQAFASGEEAVEYLKKNTADLIILDMILESGMNCDETFAKIREMHPDQRAIIASEFAESLDLEKMQIPDEGIHIKKPYSLKKIGLVVKDTLAG